jgi:Tfp pilus assembly protein PilN
MRAVNLIPPDERRGDSAPLRTGSLIYVLVAGLGVLLLGIVAVALTSKQIDDRESQKASLQQELNQATAEAQSVAAFTSFRSVQENRAATVASLAESRFDWSRVLQELALTLPSDVSLTSLTGTVAPDVDIQAEASSSSDGGGTDLRGNIEGPALEITGCAPSQDAVAGFVATLEDIDGVTRVGVGSSKLPDESSSPGGFTGEPGDGATGAAASGDCQTGPTIAKFDIVAAFDAVDTPSTATSAPSVPSTAATASATPTADAGVGGG